MKSDEVNHDQDHIVYLPGPHREKVVVIDRHPEGCDPNDCPVDKALKEWLASPDCYIAVQGYYFTGKGTAFLRCAWQPGPPT